MEQLTKTEKKYPELLLHQFDGNDFKKGNDENALINLILKQKLSDGKIFINLKMVHENCILEIKSRYDIISRFDYHPAHTIYEYFYYDYRLDYESSYESIKNKLKSLKQESSPEIINMIIKVSEFIKNDRFKFLDKNGECN